MFRVVLSTGSYAFWLIAISLLCLLLERIRPWRRKQRLLRRQFGQDLFFLVFNGHFFPILLASVAAYLLRGLPDQGHGLLGGAPWAVQFLVVFLAKDFLEWCVHRLLHAVPWLWQFHKLHHSIQELDWIGNFRFHWMEIVVYKSLTYLPLLLLEVPGDVILPIAVVSTLIGDLNHANLFISWGPLRYVLNSPRMHVWHHDIEKHLRHGQNYAIVFSIWDWVFRTVYWPDDRKQPEQLGFTRQRFFPTGLLARLVYPFWKKTGPREGRTS